MSDSPHKNDAASSGWGRYVAILILLIASAVAYWSGRQMKAISEATDTVMVDEERLDFGEAWEDSQFRWTVPIANRTARQVVIAGFAASCSCVSIEPQTLDLLPGQTAVLTLTLDLTKGRPLGKEVSAWDYEEQVVPQIVGVAPGQVRWTVRGRVNSVLQLSSTVLDWGELVSGAKVQRKRIEARSNLSPVRWGTKHDPELLAVRLMRHPEDPRTIEIEVAPSNTLLHGPFDMVLEIDVTTSEGRRMPARSVRARGWVVGEICPLPAEVHFGPQLLEEKIEEIVSLNPPSGKRITLEGVQTQSPDIIATRADMRGAADQNVQGVRIRQTITKLGLQTAVVEIVARSEDGRVYRVPVQVSYYGMRKGKG